MSPRKSYSKHMTPEEREAYNSARRGNRSCEYSLRKRPAGSRVDESMNIAEKKRREYLHGMQSFAYQLGKGDVDERIHQAKSLGYQLGKADLDEQVLATTNAQWKDAKQCMRADYLSEGYRDACKDILKVGPVKFKDVANQKRGRVEQAPAFLKRRRGFK